MDTRLELRVAALVVLAEPTPPSSDELIRLVVLIKQFIADSLGVPDYHIVVNLQTFSIQHHCRQPIGQPMRSKHLVKQSLVVLILSLNILAEQNLKELCF